MKCYFYSLIIGLVACSQPESDFEILSTPPEQIMDATHYLPEYCRLSDRSAYHAEIEINEGTHHVYLQHAGAELFGTPYRVYILDALSKPISHGDITAPQDYEPHSITRFNPLTIVFRSPAGQDLSEPTEVLIKSLISVQNEDKEIRLEFEKLKAEQDG
jgi:hypothetical protein